MIPPGNLDISGEQHGTTYVLRLHGEVDVCGREGLRAAISSALDRGPRTLVLDMSAVEFIDCSGLSVLMWAHRLMTADSGQLLIMGCRPAALRLIHLTGADQDLHLVPADALDTPDGGRQRGPGAVRAHAFKRCGGAEATAHVP